MVKYLALTQIITCVHTYAVTGGGGAGAKSTLQQMGPTPNFPRLLRNSMLQTISLLNKCPISPRLLCVYVSIPAVAEQECQNLPVSTLQPHRTYVNIPLWFKFGSGQFCPWVLSLPTSVCVSACLSVCESQSCPHDNSSPVQARITKFGPEVLNTLVEIPMVLGVIDLDLQGQI